MSLQSDGLEVFINIREKSPSLPVILVTAYMEIMSQKIEKALERGAYKCFYKPFSIEKLYKALGDIRAKEIARFFRKKR